MAVERKTVMLECTEIVTTICNQCGSRFSKNGPASIFNPPEIQVRTLMRVYSFHLCSECFNALLNGFRIPYDFWEID